MEKVKARMLAHVEEVVNIEPIPNCDNIEYVTVLGWHVIQKKNSVKVGDKVVYIEIDSQVPKDNPSFAFLESRKYKVKSIKMKGVISQGLIMAFGDLGLNPDNYNIGDDLTDKLGIVKIDTEEEQRLKEEEDALNLARSNHKKFFNNKLVKFLMKFAWFRKLVLPKRAKDTKGFPSWIHKTDETRIENLPNILSDQNKVWLKTEKIDGTSSTFALRKLGRNKFEFVVCSRNVRQAHKMTLEDLKNNPNKYWEIALRYNIETVLKALLEKSNDPVVILQGEIIGEGIQGNPYKLKGSQFKAYNLIFSDPGKNTYTRMNSNNGKEMLEPYGIDWVPILGETTLPSTIEEMKMEAEGESKITKGVKREGIVYRSLDGQESFKNVSNSYLLKHNG